MNEPVAIPEGKARDWITAFESEPPLHTHFPVRLPNGKSVPGVHVVCSCCNGRISGDRIHGRVIQSLPHVVTVSANGYCEPCDHMTHIDCRFRSVSDETLIEWLSSGGQWQAKAIRKPTLGEKLARATRRLVDWFRATM